MIRIRIVNYIIAAMFLFLGLWLFNFNVLQGRELRAQSDKNCVRLLSQWGARGAIYDRAGNLLAGNSLSYDVMVMPQGQGSRNQALTAVANVLKKDQAKLNKAYRNNFIGPSLPVLIASGITREQAIALEELKNDIPSIIVQSRPVRSYPYGSLACHLTGYLSQIDRWRLTKLEDYGYKTKDVVGFGGIEEKYDYYLRQDEGGLSFEVDHKGRFVRVLGFKPPTNGKDVQLTLDLKVQKIVEANLADKKGAVVVMDPSTGEILAMASFPKFEPGLFNGNADSTVAGLVNNPDALLVNRAISFAYPPGSVFKAVVAAAALETGKIDLSTEYVCQGVVFIGKQKFECSGVHGPQNLTQALAHSCNIFFYKSGLLLGGQNMHDWAVKFGFSRPDEIDLPYEISGFIPSPRWRKVNKFKNWFNGDTANMSIGQGDCLTTPLQVTRMMAVFANRGYLVKPYVAQAIDGGEIFAYQKKIISLGLKESTLNQVREGLRDAVSTPKGTANSLSELPVAVAGKTGTAQAPPGRSHGWFCGFFPFDEPKYVICVFLERGGSGAAAVAVTKQIIAAMCAEGAA
ncbi:MAG: penicillin-binding protein 2 [Candidatus Omnitrophota bacterium]|nr:penicillin-binding protein 2 [Candidatus Omnitrophota bacterium]